MRAENIATSDIDEGLKLMMQATMGFFGARGVVKALVKK
jgi:hypothetical protein